MENETQQPQAQLPKEQEFPLKYEDFEGKIWLMRRTKNPRAFIREDGVKLSHTVVLHNYEYRGKAFYKSKQKKKKETSV